MLKKVEHIKSHLDIAWLTGHMVGWCDTLRPYGRGVGPGAIRRQTREALVQAGMPSRVARVVTNGAYLLGAKAGADLKKRQKEEGLF